MKMKKKKKKKKTNKKKKKKLQVSRLKDKLICSCTEEARYQNN